MIKSMGLVNFKNWQQTGVVDLAPLTLFFGPNSSGKSSLLNFWVLLKQTFESENFMTVLQLSGAPGRSMNFGTFENIIHAHDTQLPFKFSFSWNPLPEQKSGFWGPKPELAEFKADIILLDDRMKVQHMEYSISGYLGHTPEPPKDERPATYKWTSSKPNKIERIDDYETVVFENMHYHGLFRVYEDQANVNFGGESLMRIFMLQAEMFQELFSRLFHLGPVRALPERLYTWNQTSVTDTGRTGEFAAEALLDELNTGTVQALLLGKELLLERASFWLRKFGVADDLKIESIDSRRRYFELLIKTKHSSTYNPIVDVGFGTSQILPIIIQSYLAPEGSVLLLEQPEMHLHPSVQSDLADLIIEVSKARKIQFIIESHSEHLLRRIQQRIALEEIAPSFAKVYFCEPTSSGSHLEELRVDEFGQIVNWPKNFFGSVEDELLTMTQARLNRQRRKRN